MLAALSMLPTPSPTLAVLFRTLTSMSVAHTHPTSHLASLDIPRIFRQAPRLTHTIFPTTRLIRNISSTRMSHALVRARYAAMVHHRERWEYIIGWIVVRHLQNRYSIIRKHFRN